MSNNLLTYSQLKAQKAHEFYLKFRILQKKFALEVRFYAILNGIKKYVKKYNNNNNIIIRYDKHQHNSGYDCISVIENDKMILFKYGYNINNYDKCFNNLVHNFINVSINEEYKTATEKFTLLYNDIKTAYKINMVALEFKISDLPLYDHLQNDTYDLIKYRPKTILCCNNKYNKNYSFKYLDSVLMIKDITIFNLYDIDDDTIKKIVYEFYRDINGFYKRSTKKMIEFLTLRKRIYLQQKEEKTNCSVCLETTDFYTSVCNHELCKNCYLRIEKLNNCCPLCRHKLDKKIEYFNNEKKELEVKFLEYEEEENDKDEDIEITVEVKTLIHNKVVYYCDDYYNVFNSHTHEYIGTFKNNKINRILME